MQVLEIKNNYFLLKLMINKSIFVLAVTLINIEIKLPGNNTIIPVLCF